MKIAIFIAFFLGCVCMGGDLGLNTNDDKLNKLKKIFNIGTVLSMTVLYILGIFLVIENNHIVPAIEVYRGNTTLQITYEDSIPVDSVVVYKNK